MCIETIGLTHIYSRGTAIETRAIDNVNTRFEQGSWTAIVGPTGSGKTTFIQHLNGLIKPTFGKIIVNGMNSRSKKLPLQELRRRVGLVFQYPEHQIFETSVYKEIAFGPLNLGWPEQKVHSGVENALNRVGLDYHKFKDRVPIDLSGGEKRRVAIASVLAMEPQVLVLDEATAGLDPKGRRSLLDEISNMQKETGLTIIWVTHNLDEVLAYAQKVLVFHQGRVVSEGEPVKVFQDVSFLQEVGLGVPQLLELEFKLRQKGLEVEKGFSTLNEAKKSIAKLLRGAVK